MISYRQTEGTGWSRHKKGGGGASYSTTIPIKSDCTINKSHVFNVYSGKYMSLSQINNTK
jgi:hypothetical protein